MHRALLLRQLKGRTLPSLGCIHYFQTSIDRASLVYSCKNFATTYHRNVSSSAAPPEKPPSSSGRALILGSAAVATGILAAHQAGYIKLPDGNKEHESPAVGGILSEKRKDAENLEDKLHNSGVVEDEKTFSAEEINHPATLNTVEKSEVEEPSSTYGTHESTYEGESQHDEGTEPFILKNMPPAENGVEKPSSQDDLTLKDDTSIREVTKESISHNLQHENGHVLHNKSADNELEENAEGPGNLAASSESVLSSISQDKEEEVSNKSLDESFFDSGLLPNEVISTSPVKGSLVNEYADNAAEKEVSPSSNNVDTSRDGKIILDLIEAIHAAERKQAELDAYEFSEEKRLLEDKYKKELKDAWARELMFAEEAASLDKELNKERARSAASMKLLQEKADEKLRTELQQKEEETKLLIEKAKELAKAETAAAVASEKSAQLEKLAEANLHINALCMAFYARSEETRQIHSVHKLVLGIIALEDALARGFPIEKEISSLQASVEGVDKDSFFDFVLSSLPDETLKFGTFTHLQLNQKFEALKRTLRHLTLIPAGGGGLIAHGLAYVASFLKVKENAASGKGIESVIAQVERLLAEGKLVEAADALESGVSGSQAEGLASEWVRLARNRAITEQALSLLQSYATAVSST